MSRYAYAGGSPLALGSALGSGGEATVYAVLGNPAQAAKIYHQPTSVRAAKLQVMQAHPPRDPSADTAHPSIAWPLGLVYDSGGTPVGFLMPRFPGGSFRPLLEFYNPQTRLDHAPGFTWAYLLRTAANLAAVVAALHAQGTVIGDLNESNLLVNRSALVTLIDCDSMQVTGPDGTVFRCPVGKPEYTPPELQGVDFSRVNRVPAHDLFGLAVLVSLLLMEGVHPFQGVWQGAGDPPTLEENIAAGRCPYAGATDLRPPPYALPFTILPPAVQDLMRRCFGPGARDPVARPPAQEWCVALEAAAADLATCAVNPQHRYSRHLGDECPWCARIARLHLPDPFPLPGQELPRRERPARPALPRVATGGRVAALPVVIAGGGRGGSVLTATPQWTPSTGVAVAGGGGACLGCVGALFVALFLLGALTDPRINRSAESIRDAATATARAAPILPPTLMPLPRPTLTPLARP